MVTVSVSNAVTGGGVYFAVASIVVPISVVVGGDGVTATLASVGALLRGGGD